MKYVGFTPDLFNKIVGYLANRPFGEVENFFNEIRTTVKPFDIPDTPMEGGDVSDVQSTTSNTEPETPSEQTDGEKSDGQESQPDQQGESESGN